MQHPLVIRHLIWLLLIGSLHDAHSADPYLPSRGPIQTWNLEVSALVWEAHAWWGAAQGSFETCGVENRWVSQPFTVTRPDGQQCIYYSLYWSQRRRLWAIYNALPSYTTCAQLDAMASLVPDPLHPLSCEQLQRDFGAFTGR